jgi:predicted glycoside hydrolase/deacetylase ChbG (UPF0249 family)
VSRKKRVIITADDLGRWPEVNDAVMAGYDAGVVTSAGLRVSAPASHSAMVSAAMRPGLGVGLHLVLCKGTSTMPRKHVPNLVDSAGNFVGRPLEAAWLYRRGAGLRRELRVEIRGQIEKFLASGLFLSHISASYNLHLHPTVLSILKELAGDYPISAIRKPCRELWRWSQRYARPGWERTLETKMMLPVLAWGRARSGIFLGPDRVIPLGAERPVTEDAVAARLASVRRGVTELVCYPGSLSSRYDGSGDEAVITSKTVKATVEAAGIELISYRDIAEGM